ncbi:lipid kinase, YegS/Rv2252/BmrU family [Pedobacter westerhofensis]|uniref:Lipid kinase, YegS/Rv2252/BmrU family n=1 Tax=Pedobacter westerhofensis TaxID=425512 RepID=A0A521AFV1_9SPHI|nr:YegS/Rv2252/BmrU family lipid kinase [Pedobacter westerhofensis]SMO33638.1 lipid kinase, YegS/Rv2252/BmrU family [Pedobacter westerhofensis]
MSFKHITFIINPGAAKQEPVLSLINQAMNAFGGEWDIMITKKNRGPGVIAAELIGNTDLVVVYGGDGCVTEVAAVLKGSALPMAILPGGTANVMAKELGIPQDTAQALEILKNESYQIISVDMGMMNDEPFLLRVNIGIMADMVITADRKLKDSIGQLAYGFTALKTVSAAEPVTYRLEIDGEEIVEQGVSLTITNSGHIGIGEFSLQPGISISDGFLDVILMKDSNFISILKIAGNTLLQSTTDALLHWKCKTAVVNMDSPVNFICDDREVQAGQIKINVVPAAIQLLVPMIH